jgi:hypothetical protein
MPTGTFTEKKDTDRLNLGVPGDAPAWLDSMRRGGSKAGTTFCPAMISIRSGLKSRASQRHRNILFPTGRKMGPPNYLANRNPPALGCPGAGGWRAISRTKN